MKGGMAICGLLALGGCAGGGASGGVAAPGAWAAEFTPAPPARPTTGIALPVGKCVNLGNMLEPPTEAGWGGRPFEDADAARIRARGFSSVRLPVRFSGHALDAPPYTIDPAFMARVRHVIEANLDAGLNVLLELSRL